METDQGKTPNIVDLWPLYIYTHTHPKQTIIKQKLNKKSEYGLQAATIAKSMPRAGRTHHSPLGGVIGHQRGGMAEAGLAVDDAESQVKLCQPPSLPLL